MDAGFSEAQSDNLPVIDATMMAVYFKNCPDFWNAEIKGVKAERSARESYGDKAVGYVQVKRDGDICIVKGRVTPEHKVRNKAYSVEVRCNETEEVVLSSQCQDCAASEGGCKHAVAFLAWLHRRSEDPSPTAVECYWKKSSLSCVGSSIKMCRASELGKKSVEKLPLGDMSLFKEFLTIAESVGETDMQIAPYFLTPAAENTAALHYLHSQFKLNGMGMDAEDFCVFAQEKMSDNICLLVEKATVKQADSSLWHELRFARITASKIYAASRCQTFEGSLTETLLGAKIKRTNAMQRGLALEHDVFEDLKTKLNEPIRKCGLLLNPKYPFFGASPDGIGNTFVVEIKCPISFKTMKKYFSEDGTIPAPQYNAQMQLQMLFAGRTKALFCVAHHDYDKSKATTELWIDFDRDYCQKLITQCFDFWSRAIYTKL